MKKQQLTSALLIAISIVLVAGGPVQSVNAQSVTGSSSLQSSLASLTQLKQKITTAIDSSVNKLKQSQENLNFSLNVTVDENGVVTNVKSGENSASASVGKDGANANIKGSNGSSASGTIGKDGASGEAKSSNGGTATGSVGKDGVSGSVSTSKGSNAAISAGLGTVTGSLSIPSDIKDKLKAANQKAIDKLEELKEKVESANKLEDLKEKAQEFDQAFKEIAIANVQATVTKSIDSMTKVLDRLQVAANNLESQVNKIKECLQSTKVDASGDANASDGKLNANGSISASALKCEDLNVDANAGDAAASLQEKIDAAKSTMQTIRSFLSSTISLVGELKSGGYTNTMASFQGISSQVDIVANLALTVQNDLVNLSTSIKKA